MKYTLGTAAKATGKSKSTIHRAIKNGVLSAVVHDNGFYEIEPSELHRVYPPVASSSCEEPIKERDATQEETRLLQQENEFLKQQLEREREFSSDLRRRLDLSEEDRRDAQGKLNALLTYQPKAEAIPPKIELEQPQPSKPLRWWEKRIF